MSMNRFCQQLNRHHSEAKDGRMHDFHRAKFPSQSFSSYTQSTWSLRLKKKTCFVLTFVFAVWLGETSVWAQQRPLPGTKDKKSADKKSTDNKVATPQAGDKFQQPDPDWLPPTFQPLPEPLAIMSLELPIVSKEELAKLKKEFANKFTKALRDCDLSANGKQNIEGGIRYKLAEMTLQEKKKDLPDFYKLPDLHKNLMREITSGVGSPTAKPADVALTVQFVNQEIVKQIPELLVNNFYVRLHAVLILSEMDYPGAYALLLQVIQAKDIQDDPVKGQPEAIKIAAMQGLVRILRFTAPPVKDRSVIAMAIVDELQKTETHWWYQLRMIDGLRHMTVSIDAGNNKPFVIDALLAVIKDPKRAWPVRAKACYALGRVPIPAAVNPTDVVTAIADCSLQLSNAAQARPNNPIWKNCFWDLYLAFKPDGTKEKDGKDKDLDAEKKVAGGLLARFKPAAQPAYEVVVPICSGVIQGKAPDPGDVMKLSAFVKARVGQDGGALLKEAEPKTGQPQKNNTVNISPNPQLNNAGNGSSEPVSTRRP
jgi:hypothetical protein